MGIGQERRKKEQRMGRKSEEREEHAENEERYSLEWKSSYSVAI